MPKRPKVVGKGKFLECLICTERFSEEEILSGKYRLETMICSYCYSRLQRKPHHQSCFGKPTTNLPDGKRLLGYNAKALECKELCPDREVCRLVILGPSV